MSTNLKESELQMLLKLVALGDSRAAVDLSQRIHKLCALLQGPEGSGSSTPTTENKK